MTDTLDVAGAMIGFTIVLTVVVLLQNLVTIYCAIDSIVNHIRWSFIERFGGGIVVYSDSSPFEDVAWHSIYSKIESARAKGFKLVDMALYINSDGEYVWEALLKAVKNDD